MQALSQLSYSPTEGRQRYAAGPCAVKEGAGARRMRCAPDYWTVTVIEREERPNALVAYSL